MFTVTKYPQGTFSWADCTSTHVEQGRKFYAELMGWTTEDVPMGNDQMYTFFKKDGHTAAAIAPMQPDMQAGGMPSVWNTYVTVDDVDGMVEKVTAAGGTVVAPPFDVFDNGRMMVIQDPTGAMISLWQPINHIGAYIVNAPGAMCWNELATPDIEKAKAFFADVLGWTYGEAPMPGYAMIQNNGRMNGGMIQMTEEWGDMPAHWMVYFTVEDIEDTVKRVPELGGKVLVPVSQTGVGRFSVIGDPSGAIFTAIQLNQADPWVE